MPAEGDPREVIYYIDAVASRAIEALMPNMGTTETRLSTLDGLSGYLQNAAECASIDELPRHTRLRFLKRLILRVARLFTHRQVAFNRAALAALHDLGAAAEAMRVELGSLRDEVDGLGRQVDGLVQEEVEALRQEMSRRIASAAAGVASVEVGLQEALEFAHRLETEVNQVSLRVFDVARDQAAGRTELRVQQSQLEMLLREARAHLPEPDGTKPFLATLSREFDERLESLYAQFEEAFRGSRDEISQRQKVYLDYVYSLRGQDAPVVDLGCGRGEWLDLLKQHGVPAYGVDTNRPFVEMNLERGLDVRLGDALEHLRQVPQSSLGAVTGFHFAEHVDLLALIEVIDAALRALRPGGLVILETPNPTNIVVGSAAFYLDPTHLKPLHPQFLEFLVRARGFVDVELRYLNPFPEPPFVVPLMPDEGQTQAMQRIVDQLNWALHGPQDFAVIGRKAAPSPAA